MKKLSTFLTIVVLLFSTVAVALDSDEVSAKVKTAFSKDFAGAAGVSWEKSKNLYLATFTINGNELNAAYNEAGDLVSASRKIETAALPIPISLALTKKYEGYTFSEKALESDVEGFTNYYLSAENNRLLLKLKCSISGDIEVVEKIKKS